VVVVKESAEEITGQEAKSTLKGGDPYILVCIGCGEVFTYGRMPLQHDAILEKVICNELLNPASICNECLKQMRVRGSHGREEDSLRRGTGVSEEMEITWRMMRNGSGVRSD
jgi:hypothetical protein